MSPTIGKMAQCSEVDLQEALQESFRSLSTGHEQMREKQKEAVLAILGGKDIFICLPTGYGKTIITAVLPRALDSLRTDREPDMHLMVLCICPLISLMMNQRRRLQSMDLTADFLGNAQEDNKAVEAIVAGKVQGIFVSPERILNNLMAREILESSLPAILGCSCH